MRNTGRDREAAAAALDLGSTRIKAARLDRRDRLAKVDWEAAPDLEVRGVICEGDPDLYARIADRLLRRLAGGPPTAIPIGLASQRSTFTLWDPATGRPLLPMISWLDRRGAGWCRRNGEFLAGAAARTGLVLTGHHAGPKLAGLFENRPELAEAADRDRLRFGTLETFLLWRWSGGRVHETDPSMAARTGLFDLAAGDWSDILLGGFGVPRSILPRIRPSSGWRVSLGHGLEAAASMADQAAAAASVFEPGRACALVNLGTGGFVLRPADGPAGRPPGYLAAVLPGDGTGPARYALEGTINGAAFTLDRFGPIGSGLPDTDPSPEAFALPDSGGLGAPHWRSDLDLVLSPAARALDPRGRGRVVLEGLLFRVREILEDLFPEGLPRRIVLTGGLAARTEVAAGLADLLGAELEIPEETECTLLGAARIAAGREPFAPGPFRRILPPESPGYLKDKYPAWRAWLESVLRK